MENTNTVPCVWVACSCNSCDSCNKCGGAGGKYTPVTRIRVTTPPWTDQLGTIESVDGAYNIIRLDSSEHPDDVQELYPNEFVVLCYRCEHDKHEPGQCKVLHVYARGPNDPPGNQGCLCGFDFKTITTNSNEDAGWTISSLSGSESIPKRGETFTCSCVKCSNEIKSLCECCDALGCDVS